MTKVNSRSVPLLPELVIPFEFVLEVAIYPKQNYCGGCEMKSYQLDVVTEVGKSMHVTPFGQAVNPAGPGSLFFAEEILTQGLFVATDRCY